MLELPLLTATARLTTGCIVKPAQTDSPSYVQLFASHDAVGAPKNWFVANRPGFFDGLKSGNSSMTMCGEDPTAFPTTHPTLKPTLTKQPTPFTPFTKSPTPKADGSTAMLSRGLATPANSPTYSSEKSECCMGSTSAMYLVACITNDYPTADIFDPAFAKDEKESKHKFKKHKFNEHCVAVHGICGSPCGFSTEFPDSKYCKQLDPVNKPGVFSIPEQYLIGGICDDDDDDSEYGCDDDNFIDTDDGGWGSGVVYSPQFHTLSLLGNIFHVLFMTFMTITVRIKTDRI